MKTKIYIGIESGGIREVFRSKAEPTAEATPHYSAVIGPFRTLRGAEYCQRYGGSNPHIQCVADAERLAAIHAGQRTLCAGIANHLAPKFSYSLQ